MGLFNLFGGTDINQGLKEYENTAGAVLLDVRTPQEYKDGHVPGSKGGYRQNGYTCFCILPFWRQEPAGGGNAGTDGIWQCKKHRRYQRL